MDPSPIPEFAIPNVLLGEKLGHGGFGAVYRGRHLGLDVDVAVKILDADAADPASIERELAEARLMAKLDHPNVLRVHDAGRSGPFLYLVLEIMDGGNCSGLRLVSPSRGLDLTRQLLAGLQSLHEARIIHRDIKPANCLLRIRDDRVKLADLGIAIEQATKGAPPSDTAGTIPFMAPELFEYPPRYGVASDLYALGMTLACLFLGEKPYPSGPVGQLVAWVREGDRPRLTAGRPDMPHELTNLVDRMLAKEPDRRPSSASESLAAIGRVTLVSQVNLSDDAKASINWGPWVLGAQILATANWNSYAVTHARSGRPGRLSQLSAGGPMARSSGLMLASADLASRLDHPGILDVIDWGSRDGLAYLVTPPQGQSLFSLVESGGPLDEDEAVAYAEAVAEALAYLHGRGLVYQIVEPTSVVLTPDARSAQLGWPMFCVPTGSASKKPDGRSDRAMVPRYAAPEAIAGCESIETPVDIYGLGEVLYYLLVGTTPYPTLSGYPLALAKNQPPGDLRDVNPMVTAPTSRLVRNLLMPDPARRPSASSAREELHLIARRLRKQARSEEGTWTTARDPNRDH